MFSTWASGWHQIAHLVHMCASFCLDSHTLDGHCMQKWHSQRNSVHLQSATQIAFNWQSKVWGRGRGAMHNAHNCQTTWNSHFLLKGSSAKQHLLSFCCCIFSLLRDAYGLVCNSICCHSAATFSLFKRRLCTWIAPLMSECFQCTPKRWKECSHDGANVACRFSTFRWPLWHRQEHLCSIWSTFSASLMHF